MKTDVQYEPRVYARIAGDQPATRAIEILYTLGWHITSSGPLPIGGPKVDVTKYELIAYRAIGEGEDAKALAEHLEKQLP